MKKIICLLICFSLVFSMTSFCFASQTVTAPAATTPVITSGSFTSDGDVAYVKCGFRPKYVYIQLDMIYSSIMSRDRVAIFAIDGSCTQLLWDEEGGTNMYVGTIKFKSDGFSANPRGKGLIYHYVAIG